jgi:hypothetical protein
MGLFFRTFVQLLVHMQASRPIRNFLPQLFNRCNLLQYHTVDSGNSFTNFAEDGSKVQCGVKYIVCRSEPANCV